MVAREELRLGQRVWCGDAREAGVVGGLTQEWAWVLLDAGGYVYADYDELYVEAE